MKARNLKTGMAIAGREISKVRHGIGSGKGWVYLSYTDGITGTGDRYRGTRDLDNVTLPQN